MSKRANKQRNIPQPYFTNKRAAKKLSTTLHATSKQTGLRHSFNNLESWEQFSIGRIQAKQQSEMDAFFQAIPFYNFLESLSTNLTASLKPFKADVFRFANPLYSPTTIVGSISDGGRFNIGGAQVREEFPSLAKAGCLYTASSKDCALAEAAKPYGVLKMYKLNPKRSFKLWDLDSVIKIINYPNLLDTVKASNEEALWAYKKTPAIPQILVSKLRSIGGDGIVFESTKLPGHQNIAFFFKTDEESAAAFDLELLN